MSTIVIDGVTYTVVLGTKSSDEINLSGQVGNFFVLSGNGNDKVIGSLQGNNIIIVGNGNNTVIGASLHAGFNITILAGNGSNTIFTDLDRIDFNVLSAPLGGTEANPFIIPFVYGNATVIAGDGGNYVTGDGQFNQTQQNTSYVGFTVDVGTVTYISGSGNDTLIGLIDTVDHHVNNVKGLLITTHFGQVNLFGGGGTDTLVGVFNNYLSDYKSSFVICQDNSGDNFLSAGSGTNELLVGDINNRVMTLDGMYATMFNGKLTASTYECIAGDHTLVGGNGAGDVLIGDFNTFTRIATNTVASALTYSLELKAIFGDSTLIAGSGSSTLIGDVKNLTLGTDAKAHEQVIFGNDLLVSGTGNDVMIGDVQNLSILTNNENIDMEYGVDTFAFSLNKSAGADSILDFNADGVKDILQFTGVKGGASAVDAMIKNMVNDGSGHLLVNFKNGSSIDFTSINYTGQNDILDIVDSSHLQVFG